MVNFRLQAAILTGKQPSYKFNARLGGPQSCSGSFGEEKKYVTAPGT